jgi:hypothetical protein
VNIGNNHSDLASEEESESLSENEDHQCSSGSDLLNQIEDINDFMYGKRERRASLTVQLPKDMRPKEANLNKSNPSSFVFELKPVDEDQDRLDLFEFDIQHEVNELIYRYQKRINMNYHHSEIEDLKLREVQGCINKYLFTQTELGN